MLNAIIKKIKNAPRKPGVYIFYGKKGLPLYIGKASDLRTRLKNYIPVSDYKTEILSQEAKKLKMIIFRSEIEALLEESRLIKNLRPRYNIIWRDDKSYFYVAITKERFPKIFLTHKHVLNPKSYILNPTLIGPFTDGRSLRIVLRLLRKKFPYCACETAHLRNCLNAEIGNCFGFCCKKDSRLTDAETGKYKRNIKIIKNFLLGKILTKNLQGLSSEEQKAIKNILAHRDFLEADVSRFTFHASRTECYDISHLGGKETVGAMTVWHNGIADKNSWRKFKIRTAGPGDDPAAIYEVISRRLNHPEWPYPDLIIIDGGIAQLNAAQRAAKLRTSDVLKVISFAKPEQQIFGWNPFKPIQLRKMPEGLQKLIPRAIAETHRFAVAYHRKIRRSSFLVS